MSRLLQIEWLKLKSYKPFWVLCGLYALCVILVCSSGMFFMEFLKSKGADFDGIDPTILPLYDFPDVWHNITYIAAIFKVLLGFIVIITISNEARFRTIRQNVIDGLDKREFLISKLILLILVALAATVLIFFIGLITGSVYSHVQGAKYVFSSMDFLFANFLGVFAYMTFALLIALILPRAGLVIVGLFMYTIVFEPIAAVFLRHFPHINDQIRFIAEYLPVTSQSNLIHVPFPRYYFSEIQDYVSLKEVIIVLGWVVFNISMSYLVLKKKDW